MPFTLANPSEDVANPFQDLVPDNASPELTGGATPSAPAYQTVNGQTTEVAKAIAAQFEPNDVGPFSDLVQTTNPKPVTNYEQEFGQFHDLVPRSLTPETDSVMGDLQKRLDNESAPSWWQNALQGLKEVGSSFIPRSPVDVARMLTPIGGLNDATKQIYGTVHDIIEGKPVDQSIISNAPVPEIDYAAAAKTPPFSVERWRTGFQTLANLGTAALIGRGMVKEAPVRPASAPEAPVAVSPQPEPLLKTETARVPGEPTISQPREGGEANASSQPSATRVLEPEVRPSVGESASLRQQGETSLPQSDVGTQQARGPTPEEVAGPVTYEEAQARIDAIENRLEAQGHDVIHMVDASEPGSHILLQPGSGYTAMPSDLAAAYKVRESIGSEQLSSSISELSKGLSDIGLNAGETRRVLDEFALDPNNTGGVNQYLASEYAQQLAARNPEQLAEHVAYKLAAERGEMFDELKDISVKTMRDAAQSVKVVQDYFGYGRKQVSPKISVTQPKAGEIRTVHEPGIFDQLARQAAEPEVSSTTPAEAKPRPAEEGGVTSPAERAVSNDWTKATEPKSDQSLGIAPPGTAQIQAAIESTRVPRTRTELDAATSGRSAKLQQSFADAERAQAEIRKVAKTERVRSAMSIYREAGGDTNLIRQQIAESKTEWFKKAATDALNLTPEQVSMVGKVGQTFDILEKRGNQYDILSAHRDNYVPHVWDVSKRGTGFGSARLKDRFKFNKARTFNTFFDGDQAGFKPKTLDISRLLPSYLHEMNTVIADRQFIQDVSGAKSTEGTPLVIPRGRVSTVETDAGGKAILVSPDAFKAAKDAEGKPIDQSQYKVLEDQHALRDWRWEGKDAEGNPIFMKDDLAVHPELARRLNAMMGQSALRKWYNEPTGRGFSPIPKAIAKNLDTAQAVMKREMFGLLAPFHQVQEGTHAVGHTVNPFFGLEDMSKPTTAHVDAMQHGLMLLPEKGSGARYIEGVGGRDTFIAQLAKKYGGRAGQVVADTINGYQDYLFHQYIPALKFKTYEHIVARNLKRFEPNLKSGELNAGDIKQLSAEQTNAAYGHLNYALLDRNPTMQHFLQLGLLAPDFLEARGRFTGQAIKGLAGKTGREQFRAIAVLAAAQAATAYTLSKVMGDEWDPTHPFEVTHNGRTYFLRSVPEDLFRLVFSGPDKRREFVSARINPLLEKIDEARQGRNYRGEKTTFTQTMGELLANYIPITARSLPGIRELTETSRNSPISPLQQLAGSLGLKISRHSPITQTYQLANQWEKDNNLPQDRGVYPVSKYQQLRYALEDGDIDKAAGEYQKLIDSGMTREKLVSGFKESLFHPFTGSKASDKKFSESLSPSDKLIFEEAQKRRREILNTFRAVPK